MYSTIKNTSKAILLSGLNVDDVLYRDAFCFVVRDEDNFNIICGDFVITINNNDNVSITQSKIPSNLPQAYILSSVDELPSDAINGSMAIVEGGEDYQGIWQFNNVVSMPTGEMPCNFNLQQTGETFYGISGENGKLYFHRDREALLVYENGVWLDEKYKTIEIYDHDINTQLAGWLKSNAIQTKMDIVGCWLFKDKIDFEGIDYYVNFIAYDEATGKMVYGNIYQDDISLMYDGDYKGVVVIENGEWTNPQFKTIWILADPQDDDFYNWLVANANKVIPSTLYTHENGEWIYKSEIV